MKYYTITGPDNGLHMCGSADVLHHEEISGIPHCSECGLKIDPFFINPYFKMRKSIYDFSLTYDSYPIVSAKFKEICFKHNCTGAYFIDLSSEPNYFIMRSQEIVPFNVELRKTQYQDYCDKCRLYGAIVGAYPAYLKCFPKSDVAETDIHFGSGNERFPILIVSGRLKELLLAEGVSGPDFGDVTISA